LQINKDLSSISNVILHPTLKETLTYKKITISKQELGLVFQKAILEASAFLNTKLLLGIFTRELNDLTLESFSSFKEMSNAMPYTCFKDYNPSSALYNKFFLSKVLVTPSL